MSLQTQQNFNYTESLQSNIMITNQKNSTLNNATQVEYPCLHCGTISHSEFCCAGCKLAYKIINYAGLSEYYTEYKDNKPVQEMSQGLKSLIETYDLPEVIKEHLKEDNSIIFKLSGIHCAGCIILLERLNRIEPEILSSSVNLSLGTLQVWFKEKPIGLTKYAELIHSLGYTATLTGDGLEDKETEKTDLLRIALAAFGAGNSMLFTLPILQTLFTGVSLEVSYLKLFSYASLIVSLPVALFSATPLYRAVFAAIATRTLTIELPLGLTVLAGYFLSVYNTVVLSSYIYFDSVNTLVFFLLITRWYNSVAQKEIYGDLTQIATILPLIAHKNDTSKSIISSKDIEKGMQLFIQPGEIFSVDAIILEGSSEVNEAILNGEPKPKVKNIGDKVSAGTLNLSGQLVVEALGRNNESSTAKIIEDVLAHATKDSKLAQWFQFGTPWFIAVVFIGCLLAVLFWYNEGLESCLKAVASVLIVSCPCGIAIASPLAIWKFLRDSASNGFIVKNIDKALMLPKIRNYFFDKTGTLSEIDPDVKLVETTLDELSLKRLVYSITKDYLRHPISNMLYNWSKLTNANSIDGEVTVIAGCGIIFKSTQQKLEMIYKLGKPAWCAKDSYHKESDFDQVWLTVNDGLKDNLLAKFKISEAPRKGVADLFGSLLKDKINCFIISGADSKSVNNFCEKLFSFSINKLSANLNTLAKGDLSSHDKLQIINDTKDTTVMVGDGVNDALALQAATVGIGIKGGFEAALSSSDIYMLNENLFEIVKLTKAVKRLKQLLFVLASFSIMYNLFGITFAILGYVTPLFAAVLMPASAITALIIVKFFPLWEKEDFCK